MPSVTVDVVASFDDCRKYWKGSSWLFGRNKTYVCAGYNSATFSKAGSGMRWLNITIPKGAIISTAYIRLHCSTSYAGTVVRSKIRGELATNPATFSDLADFDGRPRTLTTVAWDNIPAWSLNTYYNSIEIKDIIQEIIDQDGWAFGNALVLFWDDFDDRSDHNASCRRYGGAWDSTTRDPPRLYIEYTVEGASIVTTQAVSDIQETTATGNGNITNTGGENCSKRGICWNTVGNPTIVDEKSEETGSFGTGAFTRPMTGLAPATHYYVKAYAYNSAGYSYGEQVEFDTWIPPESGIDIGANPLERPGYSGSGSTYVDKNNPANASGPLHSVKVYARANIAGLIVGTFYPTNGDTLKCRDSELVGNVEAGAIRTFTELSIAVQEGDYLGCYYTEGEIEASVSGFAGAWSIAGEHIDPNDEAEYTFKSGVGRSLYGYGDIERPPPEHIPKHSGTVATLIF